MAAIVPPGRDFLLLDNEGKPSQRVNAWMQTVSGASQTLEGTGSPEGIVAGLLGWEFLDTDGPTFYKKSTDGGTTGWIALN